MPMPQLPWRVPASELGREISVNPEIGRFLLIFKLGMRTEEEQSKVPLVLNLKVVGRPALA